MPDGPVQRDVFEQLRAINPALTEDPLTSEGLMLACDDINSGKSDSTAAQTLRDTFDDRGRADDIALDAPTAGKIVQIVKPSYCPSISQ
ncbi:MAG: hypothetical protein ACT4QF_01880 [Sporichthyaceae bacterium]